MDFTMDGLAWVSSMHQKWDNFRLGDLFVQKPGEYVDAFGEHVKELLDDVAKDLLNRSNKTLQGPASDLAFEDHTIAGVCTKSEQGSEQGSLHNDQIKHMQSDILVEPAISSLQSSTNESWNWLQGICPREVLVQSSFEVASTNCLNNENYGSKVSICEVESGAYAGNAIPSLDGIPYEHHPTETRESDGSACEQASTMHDTIDMSTEIMDGFEDIKLEHFVNDFDKHELSMITHHLPKRISYKKKLKQAFRSKLWSSRNVLQQFENSHGSSIDTIQDGRTHPSFAPGSNLNVEIKQRYFDLEVSSGSSRENDWELL